MTTQDDNAILASRPTPHVSDIKQGLTSDVLKDQKDEAAAIIAAKKDILDEERDRLQADMAISKERMNNTRWKTKLVLESEDGTVKFEVPYKRDTIQLGKLEAVVKEMAVNARQHPTANADAKAWHAGQARTFQIDKEVRELRDRWHSFMPRIDHEITRAERQEEIDRMRQEKLQKELEKQAKLEENRKRTAAARAARWAHKKTDNASSDDTQPADATA